MEVAIVALEDCVKVYDLLSRAEVVSFNVPAAAFACLQDDIFIAHAEKPLVYRYQLHCSVQDWTFKTPHKLVLPDRVTALAGSECGSYLFGGLGCSLYVWCVSTGRCLATSSRHFSAITLIETNVEFTVTGSSDGFVCVYATGELLQLHQEPKPKTVINAHSLPLTDLTLHADTLYTGSVDFSVKVWQLNPLRDTTAKKQIQQGKLLQATIQYPEPVKSLAVDILSLQLVTGGESGKLYTTAIGQATVGTDAKADHKKCYQIRFSIASSELIVLDNKQLAIRCAQSKTVLRSITFTKDIKFFMVKLDKWGLAQKRQGPSKRNAPNTPLAHQVSTDEYLVKFESRRKVHCPLLDVVGYVELENVKESNAETEETSVLRRKLDLMERKNEELYLKLVHSHLH